MRYRLKLAVIALGMLNVVPAAVCDTSSKGGIVATVNGEQITYKDIDASKEDVLFNVQVRKGEKASQKLKEDPDRLNELVHSFEVQALVREIRTLVYAQQITQLDISVSENEVYQYWNEITTDMDQEAVQKEKQMLVSIYDGLMQVVVEGKNKDQVYKNQLAGVISKEQWEAHLRSFNTPKRLVALEKQIKEIDSGNVQPDEGVKAYLQQQKLQEAIDFQVAAQSNEFAQAKEKMEKGTATIDDINLVKNKRLDWWQEKYRQADIEIKDNKYSEALAILLDESHMKMQGQWLSKEQLENPSKSSEADEISTLPVTTDVESKSTEGEVSPEKLSETDKTADLETKEERNINVLVGIVVLVMMLVVISVFYLKRKK
jgi:hypothetical protein